MANQSGLSEAELRAKVMHYNFVKYLFKDLFDQIDAQLTK